MFKFFLDGEPLAWTKFKNKGTTHVYHVGRTDTTYVTVANGN